ncbi:glycosyltransferase family 4 protein [Comamonadaceae bacterium G21597-S1]|nr:glycosyltransferase family 4 protein [Comamonadaceae bacterium G21597-S1]
MRFSGIRVGLVGPLPPPSGGMANQTRQLAELLERDGARVTMVQTNRPYWPLWVSGLPVLRAWFRLVPYFWLLWKAIGKSDVVHVMANSGWSWHLFAAPAIWISRVRGVAVVVNYRGGEAAAFLAKTQRIVRVSMRRVALLVVPSAFLQQVFAGFGMQASLLPNIVDLSRFHPRPARTTDAMHLVVARNLEPLYDNATALRAFQIIKSDFAHARMTIAGSGPEEARLRELAHSLDVSDAVTFAGRLDREAMASLYRTADLMINPSLADNMPNSVLESLASGVPVVSTNVGGVPFMVRHGETALLVEPSSPSAMAHACIRVLRDDALWSRLSLAGQVEVERYTWSRVAPLLLAAYQKAMGRD